MGQHNTAVIGANYGDEGKDISPNIWLIVFKRMAKSH